MLNNKKRSLFSFFPVVAADLVALAKSNSLIINSQLPPGFLINGLDTIISNAAATIT